MEKDSKIYIAGHRGLVGSAIIRRLKIEGCKNLLTHTHAELDLTRQKKVEEFFHEERPDYVFLAAAKVGGIYANNTYPAEFIYSNLAVQDNVVHASYLHKVRKLLFLGSSCIYPRDCPQPMKEEYLLTGPLESTNEPYAVAKIAGIKMCQAYNRQYGTNFISIMPTNLYGPGDNFDLETSHALPALIRKFHLAKLAMAGDIEGIRKDEATYGPIFDLDLSNGSAVEIWGSGSPSREFLHVDDLADACVFLMKNYNSSEIINIGVGKDLTIRELAEIIAGLTGFKGSIRFDSSKPDGTPVKRLDVSKINSIGWKAKIGLEEGIKHTYNWYVENTQ